MAIVAHTEKDVDLLARLMRAEAEGDGQLGMLMAGNTPNQSRNRRLSKTS